MSDAHEINPSPSGEAEKRFKEFVYTVSHDLSGPTRAMVEFSKILKERLGGTLSGEEEEFFSLIVENGEKLQNMMDGLLDYSRLYTMAKPFTTFDCTELAKNCAELISQQQPNIECILEIESLPTITADYDQILQLFMAAIDNAYTFRKPKGTLQLSISAKEHEQGWLFAINDNGIGIAPNLHTRVFKLFATLHPDEAYSGTGMGLALAEKIIQRHAGSIWLESTPDVGTTLFFILPKTKEPNA